MSDRNRYSYRDEDDQNRSRSTRSSRNISRDSSQRASSQSASNRRSTQRDTYSDHDAYSSHDGYSSRGAYSGRDSYRSGRSVSDPSRSGHSSHLNNSSSTSSSSRMGSTRRNNVGRASRESEDYSSRDARLNHSGESGFLSRRSSTGQPSARRSGASQVVRRGDAQQPARQQPARRSMAEQPTRRSVARGVTQSSTKRSKKHSVSDIEAASSAAASTAAHEFEPATTRRARRSESNAAAVSEQPSIQSKKKRGGKAKFVIAAAIILALIGGGAAFAFTYYQNLESNLHEGLDEEDLSNYLIETDLTNEPFYMLLMGTDGSAEREADESFGDSFRTDSIILARIDPVNKKASMVSIHRDTEVDMGEYGYQKINAAHALGGASLSVKTVSDMAGVDISHYAEINFDGFKDIVDALGGIEVDVPVEIDDEDAGGHLDAGLQTLNGEQALILCRSRNTYADSADPDSMRAANQRLVLSAIANKVLSSDVATIANSVTAISKYVTTDLEVSDIIGLAQAMQGMDTSADLYTAMEPVTAAYVDGGWYTYTDEDEWKAMIARMDAGLPPAESTQYDETTGTIIASSGTDEDTTQKFATVTVENGTNRNGLATQAVGLLEAYNFMNATTADPDSSDYEETLIIYNEDSQIREAAQIQKALGGQGTIMKNDGTWDLDDGFLVIIGSDWKDQSSSSSSSSSAGSSDSANSGSSE